MSSKDGKWQADFPIREEFEDFSGKQRTFLITCHEGGLGFTVRASEEGTDHLGYETRRGLATRHITDATGDYRMLHDGLRGRITSDGDGGVVLVVDGIPLGIEDLESFLRTHEGWEFGMRIVDALE